MTLMNRRRALSLGAGLMLSGCAAPPSPPPVTRLQVVKSRRELYLLNGRTLVSRHDIALGFAPEGHKQVEGDGRTPEGTYVIDRRNPQSAYHLSLGISYPNGQDRIRAQTLGLPPGGDIFIHGGPRTPEEYARRPDWTAGCIAVTDREIERIFAMVRIGTPIDIFA